MTHVCLDNCIKLHRVMGYIKTQLEQKSEFFSSDIEIRILHNNDLYMRPSHGFWGTGGKGIYCRGTREQRSHLRGKEHKGNLEEYRR